MIGFGYDLHRLARGETLILCGVKIEAEFGTVAHSDGDAALHALCDALLGAAAMGDIGEHFPDTDTEFKGADSKKLLEITLRMVRQKNLELVNVDITIVLQKPKLKEYKPKMKRLLASLCGLPENRVNVKAKTSEKLGPVGEGLAVEAYCAVEMYYE